MTVKELINELEYFDDNDEIVVCGSNTDYVDEPCYTIDKTEMRSFWGNDRTVVVIKGNSQLGMI